MGIKERQERDREAVRRSILDAARELFVSEGYRNVSIRKIAEKIEYSPANIYGYFPSKDDIFYALAEEGFRLLHAGDDTEHFDTELRNLRPRARKLSSSASTSSAGSNRNLELMFDRSVPKSAQATTDSRSPEMKNGSWRRFGASTPARCQHLDATSSFACSRWGCSRHDG
jgi:AcrR family transcriptional regulator